MYQRRHNNEENNNPTPIATINTIIDNAMLTGNVFFRVHVNCSCSNSCLGPTSSMHDSITSKFNSILVRGPSYRTVKFLLVEALFSFDSIIDLALTRPKIASQKLRPPPPSS